MPSSNYPLNGAQATLAFVPKGAEQIVRLRTLWPTFLGNHRSIGVLSDVEDLISRFRQRDHPLDTENVAKLTIQSISPL